MTTIQPYIVHILCIVYSTCGRNGEKSETVLTEKSSIAGCNTYTH